MPPATKSDPLAARKNAARKYKPKSIKLLLIAEAPPCDTDRYFYFEEVDNHDWLFRYVWEGLTGEKPGDRAGKKEQLAALRDAGAFLIDLHEANVSSPKMTQLAPCVPDLVKRAKGLKPEAIILIKSIVHDAAFAALQSAGLPVIDERIPFPASGQQKKFLEGFRRAVKASGFAAHALRGSD